MRSAWFTRVQVEAMILAGEITDAQSIAAYAQLLVEKIPARTRGSLGISAL